MSSGIENIIFQSDALAAQHIMAAKAVAADPGIRWGVPSIDKNMLPMRGIWGDLAVIEGRQGSGKTSTLLSHAKTQARVIKQEGREHEDTVLYATLEGTVDKLYAGVISTAGGYSKTDFLWGRVPMHRIEETTVKHGILPITFLGFSPFRTPSYKQITIDMILEAAEAIKQGHKVAKRNIRALYIDYIQIVPVPGFRTRTEQVMEAVIGAKNLCVRLGVPGLIGAQASRDVDERKIKIPEPADCQWASQIEQHVDFGYSVWRPWVTEEHNPTIKAINLFGRNVPFGPRLMVLKNWKNRDDETGHWWPIFLAPEYLQLDELDIDVESYSLGSAYEN
jgi:replicative DNA helicase